MKDFYEFNFRMTNELFTEYCQKSKPLIPNDVLMYFRSLSDEPFIMTGVQAWLRTYKVPTTLIDDKEFHIEFLSYFFKAIKNLPDHGSRKYFTK